MVKDQPYDDAVELDDAGDSNEEVPTSEENDMELEQ